MSHTVILKDGVNGRSYSLRVTFEESRRLKSGTLAVDYRQISY